LSLVSALLLGGLALALHSVALPMVRKSVVVAVSAVPIGNACVRILLTGQIRQTTWLILAIVGAASFVSSRRAVTSLIAIGLLGWLTAVSAHHVNSTDVARAGFQLALAIALAAALQTLKMRREAGLRAAHQALAASEERYRTVFAASPVAISLSNEHGLFVEVNEAMCRLLGRSFEQLAGRGMAEFTHPDDLAAHASIGAQLASSGDGIVRLEKRYLRPDGETRWGWLSLTHTPGPSGQSWTLAHMHDSHDRKLAEQALIESEANLTAVAQVVHRIQSGTDARAAIVQAGIDVSGASYVCLLEPRTDPTFLHVSASTDPDLLGTQLPLDPTSATGRVYHSGQATFVADVDADPLISPALRELTGASSIYLAPVSAQNTITGVLVVGWSNRLADIGDRRVGAVTLLAAEAGIALRQASLLAELDHLAHTDQLTGLPNRRSWDEQLTRMLAQARRYGSPLTVALADLDHFKRFNDTFGHPAGDQLLKDIARLKDNALRAVDVMARWGGEEFAIALPDCTAESAPSILDRVHQSIPDHQTCSIGFATWDRVESAAQLINRVDSALYVAKRAGRNRTCAAPCPPPHALART
jgi:diguanylate cyclase (GGDEF)-like protein/PAS domain S-box-containing protein